jgi:alpha-D-xyloside xylohydrolase
MPYIYAQAKDSSAHGYPMLRTLFFEYPNDPTSWTIDDEYMFGSSLLVAPLIEPGDTRKVYLPPGTWIDYQSNKTYEGAKWHQITAGPIPVILLVKDHTALAHLKVAQSTSEMDWNNVELKIFSSDNGPVTGWFTSPQNDVFQLELNNTGRGYALKTDPLAGKVKWQVTRPTLVK